VSIVESPVPTRIAPVSLLMFDAFVRSSVDHMPGMRDAAATRNDRSRAMPLTRAA